MAVFETTALRVNYVNDLRNLAIASFVSDQFAKALKGEILPSSGVKEAANLALTYCLVKNIFWLDSDVFKECCADMLQKQFGITRNSGLAIINHLATEVSVANPEESQTKDLLFVEYATTLVLLSKWDRSFLADLGFGDTLFLEIQAILDHLDEDSPNSQLFDLIEAAIGNLGISPSAEHLAVNLLCHTLKAHGFKVTPEDGKHLMEVLFELASVGSAKSEQFSHPSLLRHHDSIALRDLLEALSKAEFIKTFDEGKTWQPLPLSFQITIPLAISELEHRDFAALNRLPPLWQAALIRHGYYPELTHRAADFMITSKPLHKCVAQAILEYTTKEQSPQYAAEAAISVLKAETSTWTKRGILDAIKDLDLSIHLPIAEKIMSEMNELKSHALTASALSAAMRHQ